MACLSFYFLRALRPPDLPRTGVGARRFTVRIDFYILITMSRGSPE